jgi:D-alanyl-D-alanine carboxypeptidase/D-alanyl-D-alanine-endopeptidase (penicillin-binding protein 4)
MHPRLRRCAVLACLVGGLAVSLADAAGPTTLPPEVVAALGRAKVPPVALSALVQEIGSTVPDLAWRTKQPVNPASVMKLVTTYAALDLLGPAWTWSTPVWLQGSVRNPGVGGVLEGNLVIRGSGDPKLVLERLWLLLRRVRQAGVREIRGDIVLDRSAFSEAGPSPADFDGEPLRPYNAQPDALLLNYKSLLLTFTPDPARGVASVASDPALAGLTVDASVPLVAGACDNWRAALKADASDPARIRFQGSYPAACGETLWPQAYADPKSYNARLIEALWRESGGALGGSVRDGSAPETRASFEFNSPPLADVVRDINKFSNNLMAQQLFLTLGLQFKGVGSSDAARAVLDPWLIDKLGDRAADMSLVNGSGLSRESRATADALALLLQRAWASPVMPEFISSLPISGRDGSLRRAAGLAGANVAGRAHLKTGSLRDVTALAGYLLAPNGRRYVLVAIINHPNAAAARPALDALVEWALAQRSAASRRD